MKLQAMTWPDVAELDRDRTLVLVPIASCEQHSRHLPTFTDSILCGAVAEDVEKAMPSEILLLPVQWLGASDHHQPFGATISASVLGHVEIVRAIVQSVLEDGFLRVFVLNGHGGNIDTMRMALRRLQPTFPDRLLAAASYWELAAQELAMLCTGPRKSMGHACEMETSMMLSVRPDLVRQNNVADDGLAPPDALAGVALARDFSQITANGAVGYPSHATAEKGAAMLAAVVEQTITACRTLLAQPIVVGRTPRFLS